MKEPKDVFTILLIAATIAAAGMNVLTFRELRRADALTKERAALTEQARTLYQAKTGELEAIAGELATLMDDARERAMIADATAESKVTK